VPCLITGTKKKKRKKKDPASFVQPVWTEKEEKGTSRSTKKKKKILYKETEEEDWARFFPQLGGRERGKGTPQRGGKEHRFRPLSLERERGKKRTLRANLEKKGGSAPAVDSMGGGGDDGLAGKKTKCRGGGEGNVGRLFFSKKRKSPKKGVARFC